MPRSSAPDPRGRSPERRGEADPQRRDRLDGDLPAGDAGDAPARDADAPLQPGTPARDADAPPSDAVTPPPTARSLGARWVEAANVVGAIVVLVPALVLGVTLFLTLGPSWPMAAAGLVAAAALWGAGWVALRRYHSAFFATARWTLGHDELVWRHGVWWRKVVTVPRSRVQHTDVSQGPFARRHGLATLVVHTAGTSHATVTLEGLDAFDARSIRDHLLTVGAADDAV